MRHEIVAVTGTDLVEHIGLHREAGHEARHMVGRTAEKPAGLIGDALMGAHAFAQVILIFRAQVVHRKPLAVLFIGHHIAVRGVCLHIVERGHGFRAFGEGRMCRYIFDLFTADIDHATVPQSFEIFLAGFKHKRFP